MLSKKQKSFILNFSCITKMISIKNISSTVLLLLCGFFGLIVIQYKISYTNNGNKKLQKFYFFKPVADSLLKLGIDTETVFLFINDYRTFFNEKYVKLNVLQYSRFAIKKEEISNSTLKKLYSFIAMNQEFLKQAEKKFDVPVEVIAAIIWTETRFGSVLGTHHLPSVFLSIAISPFVISQNSISKLNTNITNLNDINRVDTSADWIIKRSQQKAQLAIKEILALFKMKKMGFDIQSLYGSFAGAFGIPQFLPSSFVLYGYDGNNDGKIDLFSFPDAIFSIANFLHSNGWDNNSLERQQKALFAYNKSNSYVDFILELSKRLRR